MSEKNNLSLKKELAGNIDCPKSSRLKNITDRLSKSEMGKELLSFLDDNDYKINLEKIDDETGGYHSSYKKIIVLNENKNTDYLIYALAHEARHARQDTNENNRLSTNLSPETAIGLIYTSEADADTIGALACWQLKEKGDVEPWKKLTERRPNIAAEFEKSIKNNDNKEKLLTNVFNGWFKETRLIESYCCRDYIKYFQRTTAFGFMNKNIFSSSLKIENIINNVCGCNGKSYFKGNPNNPRYQYMPKDSLDIIKSFVESRKKYGIDEPEGMKTLYKNLKKIEKSTNPPLIKKENSR